MKRLLCAALTVCLMLASGICLSLPSGRANADSAAGETRYAKKKINLFVKKSASSEKLCQIPKGDSMTLIKTDGSWANVEYEDDAGKQYVGFVKKANISKSTVNPEPTVTPTPTPEPTPTPTPGPDDTPSPDETPDPSLSPSPSGFPFRPGRGGYGGSGGSSGSTGTQSITDLLGITPGKALTSGHTSGSYKALDYGALNLKIPDGAMQCLTLDKTELDLTLTSNGEPKSFTASVFSNDDGSYLVLDLESPLSALEWHIGGRAISTLRLSGVKAIVAALDGENAACVETKELFSGVVYDAVRSGGTPENQIALDIDAENGDYLAFAAFNGERRELSKIDDRVFYARGLTVTDKRSLADALTINAEE